MIGVIAIITSSLVTIKTSRISEGTNPGKSIPDIKNLINVSGSTINLSDLKGQKVLVNFWAAYDANSRRDNVLLATMANKDSSPVKIISVSVDKSKSVFEKTVVMDEVDSSSQFYVQANIHPELVELYQLDNGFKNYLIDEQGVILEVNLSPEDFSRHMIQN